MADSLVNSLQRRILHALFALSRDSQHISAATLADAVGTTPTRAAATLIELERAGLCDASRARLTMLGLAAAARMGSARGGTPRMRRLGKPAAPERRAIADHVEPLAAAPSSLS